MKLLFIEDNPDDALLEQLELEYAGLTFTAQVIDTPEALERALDEGGWSAILTDYNLPSFTGLDALRIIRARDVEVPVLVVSGMIGEERAVDAIREGANDYVMKDRLARLAPALTRELREVALRAERVRLEEELRVVQEAQRRTVEQVPIGIGTIDLDGRYRLVNERLCTMTGYAREELVGRMMRQFMHAGDLRIATSELARILRGDRVRTQCELRYMRKDGQTLWVRLTLSAVRNIHAELEHVIAILEDVTEQRESRDRLTLQGRLLECVQQAVVATDLRGSIIYWNRFAEDLYGWRAEEVIGRNILEVVPASPPTADIIAQLQSGGSWSGELELRRRDGSTFTASVLDSRLVDADGRLAGIIAVSSDITAQKKERDELRIQKEQLADAQQIAAIGSWSHDDATGREQITGELASLYGRSEDRSLERLAERIHPADRERIRLARSRAIGAFMPYSEEYRVLLRDGSERILHERGRFILDERGNALKTIGVVQDITAPKQAEEELRRRAVQQASVANLGQLALQGATMETLYAEAALAVCDVLGVDLSEVLQKNETSFTFVGGHGWSDNVLGLEKPIRRRGSQANFTIECGDIVIVTDARRETRFLPNELHVRHDVLSGVTLPIRTANGESWGVLGALSRTRRDFTPTEVDYLRSVAGILAQALERSHAEAEIAIRARQQSALAELGRRMLKPFERETLRRAAELVNEGLGIEHAFLAELTDNCRSLRFLAGNLWTDLPLEIPVSSHGQAGFTILTGEPVVVDDYRVETRFDLQRVTSDHGILSGAMVPIVGATRTYGVLSAQSRSRRRFTEPDVRFLQTVASMLAEAMEREHAQNALVASEERYRRILTGAKEIIFTLDGNGAFVTLNPAFATLTGWTGEEWIGRHFNELVAEPYRAETTTLFGHLLTTGENVSIELEITGRHGNVMLDVTSFSSSDGPVEVYGFARDITATRRAEREREQLTRNLQLLLESTLEGICTVDPDGRCTMINRAAAKMLGYEPEELLGTEVFALLQPALEWKTPFREIVDSGEPIVLVNAIFAHKNGSAVPVECSAAPITDGEVRVGVVVTFIDESERRKLEAKLEQVSRVSSLGRLSAMVAHEFNNVLAGISPFVDALRLNPTPENVAIGTEHIGRSVKRGRRITEDILRFAQPAEPSRTRVQPDPWLRAIALESTSLLPARYRLEVECDPSTPEMEVDPNQLHQIFTNLVLNARDAMPAGGTITLGAQQHDAHARFPFGVVAHPERFVHLTVTDTGCGMTPETLQRIYEPLFTTKPSGTGLGLPVTHQVVQRHGGEIFVESTPGQGTTFHIFLPAVVAVAEVGVTTAAGATLLPIRRSEVVMYAEEVAGMNRRSFTVT
ncbi:MAG TPA: PAS domain S-box protein [Thermoanaerobaculia bacterium]|jgi:PAS domain S-box-containing protein